MLSINQKGEGKGGAIFGTIIFLVVAYLLFKAVPIMIKVYAFEDRVREECKYAGNRKSLETVKKTLVDVAQADGLPVTAENIEMQKLHNNTLRVNINYTVPIETAFYTYQWDQKINYEAPVFD